MPDESGNQTSEVEETPGGEASYQDGGTPAPTGEQDAAGAHTGSGAGVADPGGNDNDAPAGDADDTPAADDPESPARADAARPPRGAPIA